MILLRPAAERGHTGAGWLDSRHTFSFGGYHDPAWMGFGPLRVLNEDRVAPGAGFPAHRHANMEILSWVLEGALAHQDNTGGGGTLRPGELQRMRAGHGIEHSEFNASDRAPLHFLQIWIQPDRLNLAPGYAQRAFADAELRGRLHAVATPDGAYGTLDLRQDARVFVARLAAGETVAHAPAPGRRAWLQAARGTFTLGVDGEARSLAAGDGAGIGTANPLRLTADADCELLLLDLP